MKRFAFADAIRVVLFDAGNTLLWIDHARIARLLTETGLPCDEASVRSAEMRARPRLDPYLASADKRESSETFRRYLGLFEEELGATVSPAGRAAVLAAWPTLWSRPPQDAHGTLASLAGRGYRLGVVSNSNGTVRASLETAGLGTHLGCVLDSGDVGIEKPDPRIFAMAAERLGADASQCVHVGDLNAVDVAGARAAGMHAVLLDPDGVWPPSEAPRIASLSELLVRLR